MKTRAHHTERILAALAIAGSLAFAGTASAETKAPANIRGALPSQLFDKPARREVIDFVDYMYSSQALLVAKGNPKNVKSLDDLSGIKTAAETGTRIQSW